MASDENASAPEDDDKSAMAFKELIRVLEAAASAGVESIGLEWKGSDLVVFHESGNIGAYEDRQAIAVGGYCGNREAGTNWTQAQREHATSPSRARIQRGRRGIRQFWRIRLHVDAEEEGEESAKAGRRSNARMTGGERDGQ